MYFEIHWLGRCIVGMDRSTQIVNGRNVVYSALGQAKNMALVAGMSVMLLAEPSAALAKDKPVGGQGELLDQILEKQKKGESTRCEFSLLPDVCIPLFIVFIPMQSKPW